ncbi:LAFA_0F06040g1_1 [Lachancea sp. 'fantastica']|nr:LAFA_0F06040g1_1 [Lachancea sp. 'fantastica']
MSEVKTKPQTGGIERVKNGRAGLSNGTKNTDKRQQSPFKSIKNTLLLRNHKSRKSTPKVVDEVVKNQVQEKQKSNRVEESSGSRRSSIKVQQRSSAQRVTLFKYDRVKVVNVIIKAHRSSSESSVSTAMTSHSTVLRRHISHDHSIASAETRRETCLMSDGPLEIYQIITYNSSKMPPQKMTYLCLGRKDNILHPILPKLQVTRMACTHFKISILLLNPERYWIIEFLPLAGQTEISEEVKLTFESMISTICSYRIQPHEDADSSGSLLNPHGYSLEMEDDSDLEYLLDESDSCSEETELTSEEISHDKTVNLAFKNAIRNIMVSEDRDLQRGSSTKRLSSYHGNLSSQFDSRSSKVRSSSLPMRHQAFSGKTSSLGATTWMDVDSEDYVNYHSHI